MNAYIQSVQHFCKFASLLALVGLVGLWNQSASAQQGKGKAGGGKHAAAGSARSSGTARANQNHDRRRSTQKQNGRSSFAQRGVVQGSSSVGNGGVRNELQVDPHNRDTIYAFRSTGGGGSPSRAIQFDKKQRGDATPPNTTSLEAEDKLGNFEIQRFLPMVGNAMSPTNNKSSAAKSNPNSSMVREPKSGASRAIASPRDAASGQATGKVKPSQSSLTGQDQETGEIFSFPGLGILAVDGSTTQSVVNSEGWDEVPEHLLFSAKSRPQGRMGLGFRYGGPQITSPRDPRSGLGKSKNK